MLLVLTYFQLLKATWNEVSEGELNIRGGIWPVIAGIAIGIAISEYYHHH
jgi:hypothetical protein